MRLSMRYATGFVLVLLLTAAMLQVSGCTPADDETTTPATEDATDTGDGTTQAASGGDAIIDDKCTRCHSRVQIDAAEKTREQWDATVERMIRNGADVTAEEQAAIVDFLVGE